MSTPPTPTAKTTGPTAAGSRRHNPLIRWLLDRRASTKILVAVAVVALVAVATGGVALVQLRSLHQNMEQVTDHTLASQTQLARLTAGLWATSDAIAQFVSTPTAAGKQALGEEIRAGHAMVNDAYAGYISDPDSSVEWVENTQKFHAGWQYLEGYVKVSFLNEAPPEGVTIPRDFEAGMAQFEQAQTDTKSAVAALTAFEENEAKAVSAEAEDAYATSRVIVVLVLLAGLVLAGVLALLIGRLMARQLAEVKKVLTAITAGDLTRTVPDLGADEIGDIGRAVNQAGRNLRETVTSVVIGAQTLSAASTQLAATTDRIAATSDETKAQANAVALAAEDVSRNVQVVATGSEEMGASIKEIAHNANEGAKVASQAVSMADSTNQTIAQLGDSSAEIGNVVKLITSIAEQTNLLALNATIEAARAGDAGKGFAVVAGEVKDLAQETAKATEDIAQRVAAIQNDTGSAVTAIGEITEIIARINDYQLTIASAVEEQTATTNEMNRNVTDAATGSTEIATNITTMAGAASTTTGVVAEQQAAVADLNRLSEQLQETVAHFRY